MTRLIFAGRTLILLVLSCSGSNHLIEAATEDYQQVAPAPVSREDNCPASPVVQYRGYIPLRRPPVDRDMEVLLSRPPVDRDMEVHLAELQLTGIWKSRLASTEYPLPESLQGSEGASKLRTCGEQR